MNELIGELLSRYRQHSNNPQAGRTLIFHIGARFLWHAWFELYVLGNRPKALWSLSMANFFIAQRQVSENHLLPLTTVEFVYRSAERKGRSTVTLSGTFNGWSKQKVFFHKDRKEYVLTLTLPVGRHEYVFEVDGRAVADPNAKETAANPFMQQNHSVLVLNASSSEDLERRVDAVLAAQCAPLISADMDETWIPFGAPATDNDLNILIAFLRAGGFKAVNTLATKEWFYYRVLDKLVQRLAQNNEIHLLVQLPLIFEGGKEIFVFDVQTGGYRLLPGGQHKADAFMRLALHLGPGVAVVALYGDMFEDPFNDGNAIGFAGIPLIFNQGNPVNVRATLDQVFVNSSLRGPPGTQRDLSFMTQKMQQNPPHQRPSRPRRRLGL